MLSDYDNPRPLPPAKVRRATSMAAKAEVNSTPPPAYGSTFVFPSRNTSSSNFGADILNTPIDATRRLMAAWDNESSLSSFGEQSPHPGEDLEWMNEKSREELHELLLRAHGIIKDREQELGLATNTVKKAYDHNVVLKSKHEALLARIPMSPSLSHSSSPDPLSKSLLSHSVSESNLPGPIKAHRTRKISIAMADISLLADQNAELLSKLLKLEEDATSADVAGRRELKRLEKEIVYLRDALEKTQAKSEELEGKVQSAVMGEAIRRRKEREAMRNAVRNNKTEVTPLDFAPPGSKFGGPSERYSILNISKEENHIRNGLERSPTSNQDLPDEVVSDQILVACLLDKVKELEEANERILCQQAETANQLAHVQQDALNMTMVYELLSDHDAVQLELEDEATDKSPIAKERFEVPTIRFKHLRRNIEDSISQNGSFEFPETIHGTKTRKTVLGLFDEQGGSFTKDETEASHSKPAPRRPSAKFVGGISQTSTVSSATSSFAGPLSPLHFISPLHHSDHSNGRTLQNELEMFGQGTWNLAGSHNIRTASLSNLSQFSAPSTPSPAPGSLTRMFPNEREVRTLQTGESDGESELRRPRDPSEILAENSLRLSVDPPTPDVDTGPVERTVTAQRHTSRLQNMSRTLRLRKGRWIERNSYNGNPRQMAPSIRNTGLLMSSAISMDNSQALSSDDVDNSEGCDLDGDEDAQAIVIARDEDQVMANKSFLFQAWLWFQFAIVVVIFIFAMARKGPGVVLGGGTKGVGRAMAPRRPT